MILSRADNRPPMLDKDLYDSCKSRMELYMQNREHGRMILELVKHGLLIWPTIEENGVTRTNKYVKLSAAKKIQADCDMKTTNIILKGTSLTKQEKECKLYDAFDKFTHIKVETLHKYYLRFTQLINDMNIYKMKMEQFQVNTKFLNSLPPKWSKFVTDVKLVKDLHTSNFDQLHEYLKQHDLHANEVRLMRERNQDPLALVANQQMTPPHFNTYQSSYNNSQYQQQFSPSQSPQYGSIQPPQYYSSTYPSQPQFNHSSVPPSHPYQSQINHQTSFVLQIRDDPIACLNKAMAFLIAVASLRFPTTNNQHRTTSNSRNQATIQDGRVTVQQVQGRKGQSYYSTSYKGNATSSGGNKAKLPHSETYFNDMENQSVQAMQDFEQTPVLDVIDNEITSDSNIILHEKMIDSQMDDIIKEKLALKEQVDSLEQNLSKQIKENESLLQTFAVLKNESKEKENKYMENEIDLEKKIKELDDIIFKKKVDQNYVKKENDPKAIKQKIYRKPIDYVKLNQLSEDFGKRFVPQQEFLAEQAFWYHMSNLSTKSSDASPVKMEAPKELPKSLVDKQCLEIAKKELLLENDRLLQQIMSQDVLLTMMNFMSLNGKSVIMEGKRNESCDKCFNLDVELLKTQNAHNDLLKSYSQLEKYCITLELSIHLNQEIFQKDESCDNQNALEIPEYFENNDLKAQLQDKDTTISKLKKIIKSMREKS
nr:hypothetical protein [Tanacetum cinerariifolium]